MGLREAIGRGLGGLISPAMWEGSLIRAARIFHPEGVVYRAEVTPLATDGDVRDLAQRLKGPALVRLSGGVWRGRQRDRMPDVLGVAVRFQSSEEITPLANADDQDLLFLSFPYLWQLPIGPLLTNSRDFLANTYYAQLPFEVSGLGRVKFRLVPLRAARMQGNRRERLARAAAAGLAVMRIEVRRTGAKSWTPVADLVLREQVDVDQEALHYNPFRTGRGIVPSGVLQWARLPAYMASYLGRTMAARTDK
jgi:hypothetical protein